MCTSILLRGCNPKLHTNAPGAAPSHPGMISRRAVYLGESAPQNASWPGGWVERQIRHLARSAWCEGVPASTPDLLRGCNLKLHTNAPGAAPSHPGVISRRAVYLGESAPKNTSWLEAGSSDRIGTWH